MNFFQSRLLKTNEKNNALTQAKQENVKRPVILSTDKAAYPVNVMGMSKALMEKVMISIQEIWFQKSYFCGTRYGNVMASRGSVYRYLLIKLNLTKT